MKNKVFISMIYKTFLPVLLMVGFLTGLCFVFPLSVSASTWWPVQSVDTMKYSRDMARSRATDAAFDAVIDLQVSQIASIGATHVAVGTPYDAEFLPFLRRWVSAARSHNLKVWFRGNLSGWENWFGYPSFPMQEHTPRIVQFIKGNPDLFSDGDIFTSCPECENGIFGDPRSTGQIGEYRSFLISERQAVNEAFAGIGKKVSADFYSANADVARLVFDPATTEALGGVVTIDHYVSTPQKLCADISEIAAASQGKIVLGELGVPVSDLHGSLTPNQQADWINSALTCLLDIPQVVGINYWTGVGASTSIWESNGTARPAAEVLKRFYSPDTLSGVVRDELGRPVSEAAVYYHGRTATSSADGRFSLPFYSDDRALTASAAGYHDQLLSITDNSNSAEIVLVKTRENIIFKIRKLTRRILGLIIP